MCWPVREGEHPVTQILHYSELLTSHCSGSAVLGNLLLVLIILSQISTPLWRRKKALSQTMYSHLYLRKYGFDGSNSGIYRLVLHNHWGIPVILSFKSFEHSDFNPEFKTSICKETNTYYVYLYYAEKNLLIWNVILEESFIDFTGHQKGK